MCNSIPFIELFAGIGGTRLGFEHKKLFKCVFSSEINQYARTLYKMNYGTTPHGDITKIKNQSIPPHEVLIAGFPCQAFSISGLKQGFADTRGTLFYEVVRIASYHQPKVIVLENVKHLVHHDHRNTLRVIIEQLEMLHYAVEWRILNATQFAIPQNRERIIIVASKKQPFTFSTLPLTPPPTLEDFLPEPDPLQIDILNKNSYTLIPAELVKKQPSGLMFIGYLNKNPRKKGVRENSLHLSRTHKQPNRIYSSKGVHPTLSSSETSGRYYIYQNGVVRKLTIQEAFLLMGFPSDFILHSSTAQSFKCIGNSVCVPLFSALSDAIYDQFFFHDHSD